MGSIGNRANDNKVQAMKTVIDPSYFVTGASVYYRGCPWSITSGGIELCEAIISGNPLAALTDAVPSHVDTLEISDNGTVTVRGMSWPKDDFGRYFYRKTLDADELGALHHHIVAVCVCPDLVDDDRGQYFQMAVRDWFHKMDQMQPEYGIENLFRILFGVPVDKSKPVCQMADIMKYDALAKAGAIHTIPLTWIRNMNIGCDVAMKWMVEQHWNVSFKKDVPDNYESNQEVVE